MPAGTVGGGSRLLDHDVDQAQMILTVGAVDVVARVQLVLVAGHARDVTQALAAGVVRRERDDVDRGLALRVACARAGSRCPRTSLGSARRGPP